MDQVTVIELVILLAVVFISFKLHSRRLKASALYLRRRQRVKRRHYSLSM